MNRTIGVILIVAALFFGFVGVNKLDKSGATVNFLGIKISAQDAGAKDSAYLLFGAGVLCLIGGVLMLRRK